MADDKFRQFEEQQEREREARVAHLQKVAAGRIGQLALARGKRVHPRRTRLPQPLERPRVGAARREEEAEVHSTMSGSTLCWQQVWTALSLRPRLPVGRIIVRRQQSIVRLRPLGSVQ